MTKHLARRYPYSITTGEASARVELVPVNVQRRMLRCNVLNMTGLSCLELVKLRCLVCLNYFHGSCDRAEVTFLMRENDCNFGNNLSPKTRFSISNDYKSIEIENGRLWSSCSYISIVIHFRPYVVIVKQMIAGDMYLLKWYRECIFPAYLAMGRVSNIILSKKQEVVKLR